MANEEHLAILEQGVGVWDRWREEHPDVRPDLEGAKLSGAYLIRAKLSGAYLSDAYLSGADLSYADLGSANLSGAYLSGADLSEADLGSANLRYANLRDAKLISANLAGADLGGADLRYAKLIGANHIGADLGSANLRNADLSGAKLRNADLSDADLRNVDLSGADLSKAKLSRAYIALTVFFDTNLTGAAGLDTCRHFGASNVDHRTLAQSGGLPKPFLQGCGLPDWLIEAYKLTKPGLSTSQVTDIGYELIRLRSDPSIQFYSCFISYSNTDKAFARALHDALQAKGIRCWLDEHQILPGDDVRDQIDRGINLWDKILLLCSESSLESYWVNTEIDKALKKEERLWKERKKKTLALIPLNLDGYLFKWKNSRASTLTDRHAEDLIDADEEPDKLEHALKRIEKALRSDPGAREAPPEPKL